MLERFDIIFDPMLPGWSVAAFAALALAIIAALWWARRNAWATAARLAAALVLLLALAGPQLQKEKRQPLEGIAVIVKDHTLSQRLDGRMARADAAAETLRQRLEALEGVSVRSVTLSERDGRVGTRLITALHEVLADVPPERFAGAFLVTDGQAHDVPKDATKALPPGYTGPVHVLIDGRKNERDRRVVVEQAARYGIVGKEHEVRFRVEQTGGDPTRPVAVRIRVNGEDWGTHRVLPGRSIRLQLPVAHAGQNIAEITAAPMEGGELTLRNNHAVIITRGVRDRLKVLLISGEPHPGERTWRNLLKADPSVDLVHFTILRPPEKQDGTPIRELALIAFPTRELFVEKLDSFDLIIFDRYQRRAILPEVYMANVAEYVRNGGAVLVTAGPEFAGEFSLFLSPLAEVMPVEPRMRSVITRPFRARLSDLGRRHPVTRGLHGEGLPGAEPRWGRWFRIIGGEPAKDAQVLMTGPDNEPLLLLARRGKGRIAALMSDHIWLWARKYDGGGPHVELLRRLAHWLMKEPDLEEETLEGVTAGSDLVITRRTMQKTVPPLEVTMPDGSRRTLQMQQQAEGVFVVRIADAPVGLYRLKSGALERLAAMGEVDSLEMRAITATDKVLAPVAQATGGGIVWVTAKGTVPFQEFETTRDKEGDVVNAAALAAANISVPRIVTMPVGRTMHGSGWLGVKQSEAFRLLAVERVPVFHALPALVVSLLLLGLAWRLESR